MSERPLRSREHIAQKLYTCDNCLKDIEPGDLYEAAYFATTEPVYGKGRAFVIKRKKTVVTRRRHRFPGCEFPWEDESERSIIEKEVSDYSAPEKQKEAA